MITSVRCFRDVPHAVRMTLNFVKQSSRYAEKLLGPDSRRILCTGKFISSNSPFTILSGEILCERYVSRLRTQQKDPGQQSNPNLVVFGTNVLDYYTWCKFNHD